MRTESSQPRTPHPRVNPPTHSRPSDSSVRDRLILSATNLFTRRGYAATTVREIVADAGVTKPVLYYYFGNKEGIYLELMRDAYKKFDTLLDGLHDETGPASKRILRLSDQVFSLFLDNLEAARLMYSIYYGPHQGAPFFDFDTYHLKFQDAIRRLAQEGILRGEFQKGDADDMMWAILGAVNVAMEVQLCHPETGMDRKRLARILNLILKGMRRVKDKTKVKLPAASCGASVTKPSGTPPERDTRLRQGFGAVTSRFLPAASCGASARRRVRRS